MRTGQVVVLAALTVAAAGVAIAARAEDDLAVVKRAVAGQQVARQEAPPATPRAAEERTVRRELRWLKVRVTEKGMKKARVNINVPIALVRALGDDFPIDLGHHGRWRRDRDGEVRTLRLGEVLGALEAGQPLVEVDDDDATVRIWVE